MNKVAKKFRRLLTVIILLLFFVYFLANKEQLGSIKNIHIWEVVAVALLYIGTIYINGVFTKIVLKPFKKYISNKESFYISLITAVGNFFAPVGGGLGFRAIYLKRKHGLPYSEYMATVYGNYLLVFLITGIIGLFTMTFISNYSTQYFIVLLCFVFLVLGSFALMFIRVPKFFSSEQASQVKVVRIVGKLLRNFSDGWHKIAKDKVLLLKMSVVTLANTALTFLIVFIIAGALDYHTSLSGLLLFTLLGSLSLFVNITPANIGIKEAIYIFSTSLTGFTTEQVLLIALLDRSIFFFVLMLAWLPASKLKDRVSTDILLVT